MFFYACDFNQHIIIPDSVEKCDYMFAGCALSKEYVTIPDSLKDTCKIFENTNKYYAGGWYAPIHIPIDAIEKGPMLFSECKNFLSDEVEDTKSETSLFD